MLIFCETKLLRHHKILLVVYCNDFVTYVLVAAAYHAVACSCNKHNTMMTIWLTKYSNERCERRCS